jgi:2-oxoglutarate dehydrogenase E2 component (dihydrolipoamide succinyltransferase)
MTDVVMPQMGESIVEGTLTKWLKKAGEHVERDEPLFEISTDKVDTEIPSPAAGTLQEVLVDEGATVAINTIVARIAEEGGAAAGAEAGAPAEAGPAPAAETQPDGGAEGDEAQPAAGSDMPEPEGAGGYPTVPAPQTPPDAQQAQPAAAPASGGDESTGPLSPVVRKMVREHNIDVRQLRGTGAAGGGAAAGCCCCCRAWPCCT